MKLRTSFCNGTALKKDITRFAPLWAIYLVSGVLFMMTVLPRDGSMEAARDLSSTIGPFSVINMIYAVICAQMLFGDLFQSRMCNALHAMPLKRECWFFTHVIAGLLFSLAPHLVGTLCMSLVLREAAYIGLIWMLGMALEYLFFFGLAVFCVFCVGNRVAQLAFYGILNFGSGILYWFVDTFYAPLMYGVQIPMEPFVQFCPVVQIAQMQDMLLFKWDLEGTGIYKGERLLFQGFGEGWGYLAVCAGLGVALLALALLLYRRRKLETAGSFIAVKPAEPIFAVVFTLCVGAFFAVIGQLFYGRNYVVYLVVGLIIGWFVGQMLLKRTVKVFQWKTFLKLGILGLAMGATLAVTSLDPLGITRWVPKQEAVLYAEVDSGSSIRPYSNMYLKVEDTEKLELLLQAHEAAASAGEPEAAVGVRWQSFVIRYTLNDGRQVSRYYSVYSDTRAWALLARLYGDAGDILGYNNWESFLSEVKVSIESYDLLALCDEYGAKNGVKLNAETIRKELLEALRADCNAGTLTTDTFSMDKTSYEFSVELQNTTVTWRYLVIRKDNENTMAWYEQYKDIVEMNVTK